TSSAREAARRLGLPLSSVRNILRRILQLYPYKMQSCHELLPADTAQRQAFAKWAFSKMEQDPTWVFNIFGQMKLISRFMVTLTTITVAFGRPLIPVFLMTRDRAQVNIVSIRDRLINDGKLPKYPKPPMRAEGILITLVYSS
ncbi:uncharacterized protein TNCV_1305371, partial [Trichonephila clavipes]